MNLSLGSIVPSLFLYLEARFELLILQNYDSILRNWIFTTARLSNYSRAALAVVFDLPVGLSVAYKTFIEGESSKVVSVAENIYSAL